MKIIRLFLMYGEWMAEHTGDERQVITELFGSNILPTAFTVKTPSETVLKTIQELNPDATVLVAASAREAEHALSIRQWNGQMKITPVEVGTEYRVVWEIDVVAASAREAAEAARTIQKNPGSHATVFQVSDGKETVRVDLLEPIDDLPDNSFEDETPVYRTPAERAALQDEKNRTMRHRVDNLQWPQHVIDGLDPTTPPADFNRISLSSPIEDRPYRTTYWDRALSGNLEKL